MMKFCTYCGQRFTRSEHLERHILTHTKVKPHKCQTCHVSFARRDLLSKHIKSHGNQSGLDIGAATPNGSEMSTSRAFAACNSCVKRKVKCDNDFPCQRCSLRSLPCNPRTLQGSRQEPTPADSPMPAATSNLHDMEYPTFASLASESTSSTPSSDQLRTNTAQMYVTAIDDGTPFNQSILSEVPMDFTQASDNAATDDSPFFSAPGYLNISDLDPSFLIDWSEWPTNNAPIDSHTDDHQAISQKVPHYKIKSPSLSNSNAMAIESSHYYEHPEVILGRDYWNFFKCNPSRQAGTCPRTARIFLRDLQGLSDNSNLMPLMATQIPNRPIMQIENSQLRHISESTRDKLLAVSQGFFLKAGEIHSSSEDDQYAHSPATMGHNFVGLLSLPSTSSLDLFLDSFSRTFDAFYSTFPAGILDANSLMMLANKKTSGLLVLLAISQGAMNEQCVEGSRLSGGLTEICRISLFDIIEKDVLLARDQTILQSALIFTTQATWSGDKWLMDIGAGQRGIYTAMLRHGGNFEPLAAPESTVPTITSLEHAWNVWQLHESRARLLYSWVIADQEHSLFNDRTPLISFTELRAATPNADSLWYAKTASAWQEILIQKHGFYATNLRGVFLPSPKPSLYEFFSLFLNDDLNIQSVSISPLTLRLLLCPMQGQVCHLRQMLTCFGVRPKYSQTYNSVSKTSIQLRLEEVQSLLYRWYCLWQSVMKNENPLSPVCLATLVMYHLIRLDTISNFVMIERTARQYPQVLTTTSEFEWAALIQEPRAAVIHAGQVLRAINTIPRRSRPPWWPAAIYRASLILWASSLMEGQSQSSTRPSAKANEKSSATCFRVDVLHDGDEILQRYEHHGKGQPTLADENGTACLLTDPKRTLQLCTLFIDAGMPTRLSEGIKAKLLRLSETKA